MEERFSNNSNLTIKEISAVYAVAIALRNSSTDLYKFGEYAKKYTYDRWSNAFDLIKGFEANDDCGFSTHISRAFEILDKPHDRLFIFSDMQVMDGRDYYGENAYNSLELYTDRVLMNHPPYVYSFDLGNYPSQIVPDGRIKYITALNDKILGLIPEMEKGRTLFDLITEYDI